MSENFLFLTEKMMHTFYYLVTNPNTVIPFRDFLEISPTYDFNNNIRVAIHRLRGLFRVNGYRIVSHRNVGYECVKIKSSQ